MKTASSTHRLTPWSTTRAGSRAISKSWMRTDTARPANPESVEDPMTDMNSITNFVQLTPDVGTSGQPTRDQFATIAQAGYAAVINLALPTSDHAIPDEGSVVTGFGMSYFHIPVDFKNPTAEDLNTFIGTMRALEGRKVWVHCVLNL